MTRDPTRSDIDSRIATDMDALRAASQVGLRSLAEISRGLNEPSITQNTSGDSRIMNPTNKRWLRISAAFAILAITGVVYATTNGYLFSVSVDTAGKTDQQVEDELHDQLLDEGVVDPDVKFKRNSNKTKLDIRGEKDGKEFHLERVTVGDAEPTVVTMQPPALDTEREPGMTDAQLEAKIQAQLDALGMDGTVEVNGDEVRVEVEKEIECDDDTCADLD